jgi:prenyltransferase beta subunit
MTISIKLLKTLQKGKKHLETEALGRILRFVESQRTQEDGFMDKSGKADIYYTLFGWMLSCVLGNHLHPHKMEKYLSGQDIQAMDLIHYAALMRCRMIQKLMAGRKAGFFLKTFFSSPVKIRDLEDFTDLPNSDPQSPYVRFIRLSLQEDTGQRIKNKTDILKSLDAYRVPGGGYSNIKGGNTAGTNATVAALAITGQLAGYKHHEDIEYLRELQDGSGGFSAAREAPVPDILSTATSLFMLKCYGVRPKYGSKDFIEAHWLDNGGFSATLVEENSDVEYTFYGLLALGSVV